MTLTQLSDEIGCRAPFDRDGIHGAYIAVLSWFNAPGTQDRFNALTGPLADKVRDSARDLHDRYMHLTPAIATYPDSNESDNRAVYADEVAYYVTMDVDDPEPWINRATGTRYAEVPPYAEGLCDYRPRLFRYVLGYVQHDGAVILSRPLTPHHPNPQSDDPRLTSRRADAIRFGLIRAGGRSDLYSNQLVYREN